MISEHTNLILSDNGGKNNIECIIDPGKDKIQMKMKEQTAYISMDDIYALALMILTPEKMDSLMPVRRTTITKYKKQHQVMAQKNIKKGEKVIVNCEIDVPTLVEENIKAFVKPRSKLLIT